VHAGRSAVELQGRGITEVASLDRCPSTVLALESRIQDYRPKSLRLVDVTILLGKLAQVLVVLVRSTGLLLPGIPAARHSRPLRCIVPRARREYAAVRDRMLPAQVSYIVYRSQPTKGRGISLKRKAAGGPGPSYAVRHSPHRDSLASQVSNVACQH